MAKKLPERYNPGDLEKTRTNLGDLSREEAERMADRLGGEVGVEKTDAALNEKYDRLRKTSTERAYRTAAKNGIKRKPRKTAHDPTPDVDAFSGHYARKNSAGKPLGYFERIRIDRMAARPEHRVKSRADVISTYFSFIVKSRDTVNPEFITEGDSFYYSHIEQLVTNLQTMLKQVSPSVFKTYINPFYRDLLKLLISWDLKALSRNLADLQKTPRNREIRDCGNLCSMIYKPIISSAGLDLKHFYAAVERLYKVLLIVHREDPEELVRIKNRCMAVEDKIKIIFKDIAFTCYPLLLKLTGTKFHYYREFMNKKRDLIIDYLNLDSSDLITAPTNMEKELKKQFSLKHLENRLEREKQEMLDRLKTSAPAREADEISHSLELIERLFPECGWKTLDGTIDLYPYFQALFKFPKGTELIAVEDPLQQVIVLAAIIQDLLYGFRSIQISSTYSSKIEKTVDKWHLFIDEMIQNNYNKMLIEYCRNMEKGTDYTTSNFGQKLLTDIYWYKRKFILPYLKFAILYKSESIPIKSRKFYEEVNSFYLELQKLMETFDNSKQRQLIIENYNSKFHFEIKNITSFRLKKVLAEDNIAPTNENLLRYTFMLVSLLDFLMSSENSPYYQDRTDETPVYRYDPVYQGKPLYNTELLNTEAILNKYH